MSKAKSNVHGSAALAERPATGNKPVEVEQLAKPAAKAAFLKKLEVGVQANIPWYSLHAFQERNTRKDSFGDPIADLSEQVRQVPVGEERKERGAGNVGLLIDGWETVHGTVEVTIPTPDELTLAHQQRREQLESWKRSTENDIVRMAAFVEGYWFPKGQPAHILAIANMCYRRTYCLPAVAYARYARGIDVSGHYEVPVVCKKYANDYDAFQRHLLENDKDAGRSKYTERDWLLIAKRLKSLNPSATESTLLKFGCKRGAAQKVWRLTLLDATYPQCNLYARVMADPTPIDKVTGQFPYFAPGQEGELPPGCDYLRDTGCFIPIASFDKEDLQALLTDKQTGQGRIKEDSKPRRTTAKVVEEYIRDEVLAGSRAQTWNAKDNKNLMTHPVDLVRFVGYCAVNGMRDEVFAMLKPYADEINKVVGKIVTSDQLKEEMDNKD